MRSGLMRELPYAVGLAIGASVVLAFGFLERRAELLHVTDFSGFWAGARVLLDGGDPYDLARWRSAVAALGTQTPDTPVYGYPAHVAVALVPLALLPLEAAAGVWLVLGLAVAVLGVRALLREAIPGLPVAHTLTGMALLASQPALTSLVIGQWTFLLAGALAWATALALRGHALAALPLAAFLAKPQLALVSPLALAQTVRARPRYAVALAAALGVAAVAGWLASPGWLDRWWPNVTPVRVGAVPRNATIFGAFADVLGAAGVAVAAAGLVACALLLLRFRARPRAALAAGLAFGAVAAPYSWGYDQLLLLVPAIAAGAALPRARALIAAGGVSAALLFATPLFYSLAVTRGRESASGVIPLAVYLLLVVLLWPQRIQDSVQRSGQPSATFVA